MIKNILHELKEHTPFTTLASILSIVLVLLIIKINLINSIVSVFYIFHPIHLFFSAIVSTALFYKYKKNILLSIAVGVFISVIISSFSDIIFPYIGASLFGIPISFHLPAIESPCLIFGVSILGASAGILFKKTKFPHFFHVFISVFASLLYIFAYSSNFNLLSLIFIVMITSISVVVPCCFGDIILPVLFKEKIKNKKILTIFWKSIGILNLIWFLFWFVKVKILNQYGMVSNAIMFAIASASLIVYIIITGIFLLIKWIKNKK